MKRFFKQHRKGIALFAAVFLLFHYLFLFSAPINFWLHYEGRDKIYYDKEEGWSRLYWQEPFEYQKEELPLSGFSLGEVTVYRYRKEDTYEGWEMNHVTRQNGHAVMVEYHNETGRELQNVRCQLLQWLDGKWYPPITRSASFMLPTYHPEGTGETGSFLYNESRTRLYYENFEPYKLNTGLPFYGVFRAVVSFKDQNGREYRVFSKPFFISPYWGYPAYGQEVL